MAASKSSHPGRQPMQWKFSFLGSQWRQVSNFWRVNLLNSTESSSTCLLAASQLCIYTFRSSEALLWSRRMCFQRGFSSQAFKISPSLQVLKCRGMSVKTELTDIKLFLTSIFLSCLKSQVEAMDKFYRTLFEIKCVLQTHSQHDTLVLTGARGTERSSADKKSANCHHILLARTDWRNFTESAISPENLAVSCELPRFDQMWSADWAHFESQQNI